MSSLKTQWPVQNKQATTQKHVEHQDATDIQNIFIYYHFFVFFGFFFFNLFFIYNFSNEFSKKC